MPLTEDQSLNAPMRGASTWMLAVLAFGVAPPLWSQLLGTQLAQANTWLVAALGVDAQGDIHLLRLLLRMVLPTILMLAVLRFTRLGQWIVMTPMTLCLLLIESSLLLIHTLDQVSRFVLNGDRVMPALLKGPAEPVALVCLVLAVVSLVWATAWHRSSRLRRSLAAARQALLRPI